MIGTIVIVVTLVLFLSMSGGPVGKAIRRAFLRLTTYVDKVNERIDGEQDPEPLPHRHAAVDLTDEVPTSERRFGDYIDDADPVGEEPVREITQEALDRYEPPAERYRNVHIGDKPAAGKPHRKGKGHGKR